MAFLDHVAILQVAVPLLAAPLCVMLPGRHLPWALTLAVSWFTLVCSIVLLAEVSAGGSIAYHLGNWPPPIGIEYRVDAINALVLLVVSGISAVALPYARRSVEHEIEPDRHGLFYTAYLLCLTGLLGVTITGDAFNIFVFLEISSLSTYVLVAAGARLDRRALSAAYTYLVLGTVGATFFVLGVGLLYMVTGTLNIADLAERLPPLAESRVVQAAFAFVVAGMGLKLAMFPLHTWLPNAYAYAPSLVTVFLAATATKVSVYVLLRFVYTVFGHEFAFIEPVLAWLVLPLAVIAMLAGSVVAIHQDNLKRMFAWSSIAQIGYMMLGLALASASGLTATVLHLFNHALMKGALFMALGGVMLRIGAVSLASVRGLASEMPWTFAALVIGGLSLIGVPGTVGFVSKWYLILAAIEKGWWLLALLIVAASLLAVIYVWKLVEAAYLQPAPQDRERVRDMPPDMLIPLWVLALANIWFGIDAGLTTSVAGTVVNAFLGGGS